MITTCVLLLSCGRREAHFVIRNKGDQPMMNVYITVNPGSYFSYESEKIDIPYHSQAEIFVSIPGKEFHQGYQFTYTRLGEQRSDDYSDYTSKIPASASFMIDQQLDTVWINAFEVNRKID
ncbi:MAG: hypothetical protein MJA30_26065 [Cytophagales bacterium]|nr:hypothetical protein [Cytophagales bacterium]